VAEPHAGAPRAPQPPEPVGFPGPAGRLEGLLDLPDGDPLCIAVVCHPHPLHGGTMHNKVAHTLARTLRERGAAALRFNFRGVGASEGAHAGALGETDDALAAVDWLRGRYPGLPLVLAGFSFGAGVALRAAARAQPAWLVTIAPAVDRVPLEGLQSPGCPWLLVIGAADEVVAPAAVARFAATAPGAPQLQCLPGVGHFFHGQLHQLREQLLAHWPEGLPRSA
jgi:alpha/beta superfamily hydrolase